jgi:Flp pilus assembly protein TadG
MYLARSDRRKRRSGQVVVELMIVFPVLLLLLLGTIEFSLLLSTRQQVLFAAQQGALVAAQNATCCGQVQNSGNTPPNTLQPCESTTVGLTVFGQVKTAVQNSLGAGSLLADGAQVKISCTAETMSSNGTVTVCVVIPVEQSVPNFLPIILNLSGAQLQACVTLNAQQPLVANAGTCP